MSDQILAQAAAAAPVGPVPMADPDAYALAAADQWNRVSWRCSCGATPDPADDRWRWSGLGWEHHHGGQAGHFRAEYTPPTPPPATVKAWKGVDPDAWLAEVRGSESPADGGLTVEAIRQVMTRVAAQAIKSDPVEVAYVMVPPYHVFEVIDLNGDEGYFTLGIFLNLQDAIRAIEHDDPTSIPHDADIDDYVQYAIRERAVGMTGTGREVYRRSWVRNWDDDNDCDAWKVKTELLP